jgi:soluble lytic murein transglycosylase-like protein
MSHAQTLDQYLKLRRQHKISQAVGVEALETLVGARVVEVKGVVKGTFRVGNKSAILLERVDRDTEIIDTDVIPEWLQGNEVPARLIVRASRSQSGTSLQATLLGAAPESSIAPIEAAAMKRAAALNRTAAPPVSRGGVARSYKSPEKEWTLPASEVTPIYAAFIKKQNSKLSNSEALRIAQGVVGFSLKYGVDARLIMAMVMVESGFDPSARSHVGAMGLGQLMPGTAKWMGVNNAYDSIDNLYGTVKLVRGHLEKYRKDTGDGFQSLVLTLAAYNAGEGAVKRHGGVPPYKETQAYVRRVIALYYGFAGKGR